MACFLVSAAEAAVVTAVEKAEEKKEMEMTEAGEVEVKETRIPLSRKLKWLTWMLWGGAGLLMFEHIWHGEVAPWFPFLTAMSNRADAIGMVQEMATAGVCMALLITLVWFVMCKVADRIAARDDSEAVRHTA